MKVKKNLRRWFIAHFIVDMLIAIPLFLFPEQVFILFNLPIEPLMGRIVAAGLFGIGGTSFLIRNKGKAYYDSLLNLKIIWSSTAILALLISLILGGPSSLWIFIWIFAVFLIAWVHYKKTI